MKMVLLLTLLFGSAAHAKVMTCSKSPIEWQPAQVDLRGKVAYYEGLKWSVAHKSNVMTNPNTGKHYFLMKLSRAGVFWGPGFSCYIDPIDSASDDSSVDGNVVQVGYKAKSSNDLTWTIRRNGRNYQCARIFNGVQFTHTTCYPIYDRPEDKAWLERMRQPCYEGDKMEGSPHFCM